MRLSRPVAIALLCTLITACSQSSNTDTHAGNESGGGNSKPGGLPAPSRQSQTETIEVPVTGIGLGWGYNMYDSARPPNQCIEFTASEEPAQTRTMKMTEVNDAVVFRTINQYPLWCANQSKMVAYL